MSKLIVFNATRQGASHVKKGMVCQDYSLSYQSEAGDVQIAIVCDGHGGDTYVRSDVGSRLAAEIALKNIQAFIQETPAKLFLGKKGAVTARPKNDDPTLAEAPQKKMSDMTEIELQQYEQDKQFYQAVAPIREQDQLFSLLFGRIYMQWLQAIEQHAHEHAFTEHEQTMLGAVYQKWLKEQEEGRQSIGTRIVKAYGSTLMAFVRTPLYWFAFHIGDGKLLACDSSLQWTEPVPWDCRCFLNLTTSLCDSNPVPEFRYAFNGMGGEFPVAVIMGSDGLDDSWGSFERLANFYSQTLGIFLDLGQEKAVEELAEFLPKLSAKASQDDMSMAGIIDMELIAGGVGLYRKERELKEQVAELQKLNEKRDGLEREIAELKTKVQEADEAMRLAWQEKARQYWADANSLTIERMQHRSQTMAEHSNEALAAIAQAEACPEQPLEQPETSLSEQPEASLSEQPEASPAEHVEALPSEQPLEQASEDQTSIITIDLDETGTNETV